MASIHLGTWPVAPGQTVWLMLERAAAHGEPERIEARWVRNEGENSYWVASLGPFAEGDEVRYTPKAGDGRQKVAGATSHFRVGPQIYLSLLWHHHQPIYRLPASPGSSGSNRGERYATPWVRLHALRDYHSMAALIAEQPDLHGTINFTPSGARLAIRTHCPGVLRCRWDDGPPWEQPVNPVGGVMAGASYHQVTVGPSPPGACRLHFEFQCRHAGCPGHGPCCALGWHTVKLEA
jgi:hypothetical protein